MIARTSKHRGYVLVVTLALLVLAATLLVSVSRAALDRAVRAQQATDDLQQRWGAISCRNAILPIAEQALVWQESLHKRPTPNYRTRIELGHQTFELTIADEQAKANVNTLLNDLDESRTETRLRAALAGSGMANSIRLHAEAAKFETPTSRPAAATSPATRWGAPDSTTPVAPQRISSLGQIFDALPPEKLAAIDLVTCWGSGRINLCRASEAALALAASPPLDAISIRRVIDARNSLFNRGGEVATTQAGAQPVLQRLIAASGVDMDHDKFNVSATSTCHSLWIVVQSKQRRTHYLSIRDDADVGNRRGPRIETFVW